MKPSKTVKPVPATLKPRTLSVETLRAVVGGSSNRLEEKGKR